MLSLRRYRELFVRSVSSVAYIDPGNWATDLQAGASYGYKLLFIVFVSGLTAVVFQLLAVRLGATTSLSLPTQTRLLLERLQVKHPKYRIPLKLCLWFLYGLAEIAIIGTDLAELLGTAIGLNLLFAALPLYAGVLITAADVLIVLVFFRPKSGRQGMMFFEIVIVSLVLAVFVCFIVLLHLIQPEWKEVFLGLVPSHTLIEPGALYVGVGILGATVMPHALFLGSSLASVDRLEMLPVPPDTRAQKKVKSNKLPPLNVLSKLGLRRRRQGLEKTSPNVSDIELSNLPNTGHRRHLEAEVGIGGPGPSRLSEVESEGKGGGGEDDGLCKGVDWVVGSGSRRKETDFEIAQREYEADIRYFDRIAWVDLHILHLAIDTSLSLLGFALTINAAILTLAGAAYFYAPPDVDNSDPSLGGAYELIKGYIGLSAATIFSLALLCAGQSASITATLAGQVVSEGFIEWKTSPFIRRLVTRLIGVIPAAIVAAAAGQTGFNTMLVASQVLLSIVLPTAIFPLVYLCSRDEIMTVLGPEVEVNLNESTNTTGSSTVILSRSQSQRQQLSGSVEDSVSHRVLGGGGYGPVSTSPASSRRKKSYRSPKWVTWLGYLLFTVIVVANVYVIVKLCLGN